MLDRGLARGFDPAVGRAAQNASETPISVSEEPPGPAHDADVHDRSGDGPGLRRRDLREPTSRAAGWRVWVHIADGELLREPPLAGHREAYRRGTSVYLPGAVEPMLPAELSNGACSLVPGEDRRALTVELLVRGQDVVSSALYRSVIRSDRG